VWKVANEKQLLYKAGPGNIDSVAALSAEIFITGADNGTLNVWNANKVCVFPLLSRLFVNVIPEKTNMYNSSTQHRRIAVD
jgi:hypothetical protein